MAKKNKKQAIAEENGLKIVAVNRKARRDYEIIEKIEAGIALVGSEVKSIRAGGINLKESYVRDKNGEMFLVGCHVSPYSHSPADAHEPTRDKKLLLHKKEIEKLSMKMTLKGLTIVPLRVYFRKGRCKVELGLGRGKKHYDKREDVKRREAERDMERAAMRRR